MARCLARAPRPRCCHVGMLAAAVLLGCHMALTHGVFLGMLASYIPSRPVPGLGRVSGTAWSLTDLLLGALSG